jgi:hypothetical protein
MLHAACVCIHVCVHSVPSSQCRAGHVYVSVYVQGKVGCRESRTVAAGLQQRCTLGFVPVLGHPRRSAYYAYMPRSILRAESSRPAARHVRVVYGLRFRLELLCSYVHCVNPASKGTYPHTHTHTHTYIYIYTHVCTLAAHMHTYTHAHTAVGTRAFSCFIVKDTACTGHSWQSR